MGNRRSDKTTRGQALVLMTFALFGMFGLIGLSVDLGFSFFVQRQAQAAADAAALAAARQAFNSVSNWSTWSCGDNGVVCQFSGINCAGATGNLTAACNFARENGFDSGTNQRQTVTVQSSDSSHAPTRCCTSVQGTNGCTDLGMAPCGAGINVHAPPTARCVDTIYWVTVRVSQTVPQLFSAMLNHNEGRVAARATAAVTRAQTLGSLILLNRATALETSPGGIGNNLNLRDNTTLRVPGGIVLASDAPNAGQAQAGNVVTPFTWVRAGGGVQLSGSAAWNAGPTNKPDGTAFMDPIRGKGQPPINTTSALPLRPVEGATIDSTICPGFTCQPGIYFAVSNGSPTGAQLQVNSDVFTFRGSTPGSGFSQFGDYYFFGGLHIAGTTQVNFGPGRYVMAGTTTGTVFQNDSRASLLSTYTGPNDPGRVFILTDGSNYPGMASVVNNIAAGGYSTSAISNLAFGISAIRGADNGSQVTLTGLDATHSDIIGAGLQNFAPVLVWQDQANTPVSYDPTGNVMYRGCGGALGDSIDRPCYHTMNDPNSPQLTVWTTPQTNYNGAIYQPRGAWTTLHASGTYYGGLQIVSGAVDIQGTADLTFVNPSIPITNLVSILVE